MGVELGQQGISFLCSVCLGAGLALLYDVFRILRRLRVWSTAAVAVQDVLYWAISTMGAVLIFYVVDDLALRGWYVVGGGLGVALYLAAFSPVVLWLGEHLSRGVIMLTCRVCCPVFWLLRWPVQLAKRAGKHVLRPVRAWLCWLFYRLKRLRIMGQDGQNPEKNIKNPIDKTEKKR